MLFSVLGDASMNFGQKLLTILVLVFCVLLSLSVHELGHGLAAYAMGDYTAKSSGRLSLNPLHHLDPIGAICLFLFGFGWAKPVPVNPYNFKNQKGGMVLTSLAGPFTNFILAFIAQIGVAALGSITFRSANIGYDIASVFYMICSYMVIMNLGLAIFNLIPVPPLDGSKVLSSVLPTDLYFKYMQYEQFGLILLILLINLPFFSRLLNMCVYGIMGFYSQIISLFIH